MRFSGQNFLLLESDPRPRRASPAVILVLFVLLVSNGCKRMLPDDPDVTLQTSSNTLHALHGTFIRRGQTDDPRMVVCLLPPVPYLGPVPQDGANVPNWLPFWSDLNLEALKLDPGDEVEFDVRTDWHDPKPAVITALRRIVRNPRTTTSCP